MNKYLAEIVGTMVPVLIGCSVAVSLNCSSDCTDVANVSTVIGTTMVFSLSVVVMVYTIGGISGCHMSL
jgi:aquaporin Z